MFLCIHVCLQCLGSRDISDFRGGDALAADVMKQLRQESSRLKATKLKATITLKFKGLTVFDEKSKVFKFDNVTENVHVYIYVVSDRNSDYICSE